MSAAKRSNRHLAIDREGSNELPDAHGSRRQLVLLLAAAKGEWQEMWKDATADAIIGDIAVTEEQSHQVNRGAPVTVKRRDVVGHVTRSDEARATRPPRGDDGLGSDLAVALGDDARVVNRTHEIHLMASCNQVARACGSSGGS